MITDNNNNKRIKIRRVIEKMMDKVMKKVFEEDPFDPIAHQSNKRLYAALVPDEIFKGSHFERRFTTAFGSVWEQLAEAIAIIHHGHCERGYYVHGTISQNSLIEIQSALNGLEHSTPDEVRTRPDWSKELAHILESEDDQVCALSVIADIYIESKLTNKTYSFELKSPKPNSDQTKVSKEKMFKLMAMAERPVDEAFFALPFNPYGEGMPYNWSFPKRWFDMDNDRSVLIGEEFWDVIGGPGTFTLIFEVAEALGERYKSLINEGYFGS